MFEVALGHARPGNSSATPLLARSAAITRNPLCGALLWGATAAMLIIGPHAPRMLNKNIRGLSGFGSSNPLMLCRERRNEIKKLRCRVQSVLVDQRAARAASRSANDVDKRGAQYTRKRALEIGSRLKPDGGNADVSRIRW